MPDRGGRPSAEAPPLEMPAFRKRTEPPKDQRGMGVVEIYFLTLFHSVPYQVIYATKMQLVVMML